MAFLTEPKPTRTDHNLNRGAGDGGQETLERGHRGREDELSALVTQQKQVERITVKGGVPLGRP